MMLQVNLSTTKATFIPTLTITTSTAPSTLRFVILAKVFAANPFSLCCENSGNLDEKKKEFRLVAAYTNYTYIHKGL